MLACTVEVLPRRPARQLAVNINAKRTGQLGRQANMITPGAEKPLHRLGLTGSIGISTPAAAQPTYL